MSCVHPSLAERIRIEAVACGHGRSRREIAGCPGREAIQAFFGSRARAAPNPAVVPGLPIAGPEKDEKRPPLSGRRLSSVCVSCHQTCGRL